MFEKQIAQGVALLDANVPGWLERVDVDAIDMERGEVMDAMGDCGCVLTQLDALYRWPRANGRRAVLQPGDTGVYERALMGLGLSYETDEEYGFRPGGTSRAWKRLTNEWKATILRLRAERALSHGTEGETR
jgi:hypothetical protein